MGFAGDYSANGGTAPVRMGGDRGHDGKGVTLKNLLKSMVAGALRAARPLARAWARPGYFAPCDWARIAPRRVALVCCHWIGDTLWATQVVTPLTARFPGAELHAVTKPACVDLWRGWLPAERVHAAPEVVSDSRREPVSWRALGRRARELRRLDLDLVVDLTGNRYSACFTFRLRPARALGFDGGELGWLYSHRVRDAERPGRHLCERPFRVVEPLLAAAPDPFPCPRVPRPPEAPGTAEEALREMGLDAGPFFILVPGAGWPEKEWAWESFARAGRELAARGRIIVTGAPAQRELLERVARDIPEARVSCAPVGKVLPLLRAAAGVLANDSGLAHLSAAYGRPTAAVFTGATDPLAYAPLGPAAKTFPANATPEAVAEFLLRGV